MEHIYRKKVSIFCLLVLSFLCIGCKKEVSISGYVKEISNYGTLIPSFSVEEMKAAGFDYADMLEVEFERLGTMVMPFTTAYSEVGIGGISLCDYSAKGDEFNFGVAQGSFSERIGGKVGERFTIRLKEKGGLLETYKKVQSVYTHERKDYESDEVFANFREITTTGMASKRVYRSGNPLNSEKNKGRYAFVDALAEKVGIATEIDIADTKEKIESLLSSEGYLASYCPNLYRNGKTIALGLGADMFTSVAYEKIAMAIRFMLSKENTPPFLIHCNEGKDRCGFFSMLLEATAGASIDELRGDYMVTYTNLYKFKEGSETYNLVLKNNGDRLICLMNNPKLYDDLKNIDWGKQDISKINPQEAAKNYLVNYCKLSTSEYENLKTLLTQE